jgi:hypothetical protein
MRILSRDQGSGIFLILDPEWKNSDPDPQHCNPDQLEFFRWTRIRIWWKLTVTYRYHLKNILLDECGSETLGSVTF